MGRARRSLVGSREPIERLLESPHDPGDGRKFEFLGQLHSLDHGHLSEGRPVPTPEGCLAEPLTEQADHGVRVGKVRIP